MISKYPRNGNRKDDKNGEINDDDEIIEPAQVSSKRKSTIKNDLLN